MRPRAFRRQTTRGNRSEGGYRKAIGAAVIAGVLVAGGIAGVEFANASTTPKVASSAAAKEQAAKKEAAVKEKALLEAAQNHQLSCNVLASDAAALKAIKLAKRLNVRELEKQNRKLAEKLAKQLAAADPRVSAKDKQAVRAEALLTAARINVLVACFNLAEVEVATGHSIVTAPPTTSPTASASATVTSSATATSGATSTVAPSAGATRHF